MVGPGRSAHPRQQQGIRLVISAFSGTSPAQLRYRPRRVHYLFEVIEPTLRQRSR